MGGLLTLVARRLVLRMLVVALLTTFGIHLCLSALPPKRLVDPNAKVEEQVSVRKWEMSHYLTWITSTLAFQMPISDQGTGEWEVKEFWLRVKNSLTLCLISFLIAAGLGVFLGTLDATLEFEPLSGPPSGPTWHSFKLVQGLIFVASSLPAYILAYLLFLGWGSDSSTFLAVVSLGLGSALAVDVARLTQNSHARELRSRYIESAIANGLKTQGLWPRPGYVGWHAFRNSLITILPVTAMKLPLIVSSAMIVEVVFDLPGLGESLLRALIGQDVPKILSIVLTSALFAQFCVFLSELLVYLLNPKGRVV